MSENTIKLYDANNDNLKEHTSDYNLDEKKALHEKLNNSSSIENTDLFRIALWKYNRCIHIADSTLGKLNELAITEKLAIDDPFSEEVIEELVATPGIGFPLASTILKFARPDVYPIIDIRAYRVLLGKKITYSTYSLDKYIEYAKMIGDISTKENLPFQEIDEYLYELDKTHNGKI